MTIHYFLCINEEFFLNPFVENVLRKNSSTTFNIYGDICVVITLYHLHDSMNLVLWLSNYFQNLLNMHKNGTIHTGVISDRFWHCFQHLSIWYFHQKWNYIGSGMIVVLTSYIGWVNMETQNHYIWGAVSINWKLIVSFLCTI